MTRFMFAGMNRPWTYSEYFNSCTLPTEISGERRSRLNRLTRRLRANRSLTISSVGMRPRTMRSWLVKSYAR